MEKKFTAITLREARDQAEQWLTQQKGIRLVRQKQASDFGRPGQADDNRILPETLADSDEGVGTV